MCIWALICIAAFCLATTLGLPSGAVAADVVVRFPSARYLVGELTQRLTHERGETLATPPADTIEGHLLRPPGDGPFPAIVHLHGCGGLTATRLNDANQFRRWGYVTLMVDSFTTRGIKDDCLGEHMISRDADAFGALVYLASLSFVDANRIVVVGYAQGGEAALQLASDQPAKIFDVPDKLKFKAAVAYYPSCGAAFDRLAIPTLVLIGGRDDWALAASCERLLRRFDASGASLKVTVFPDAYHSFDDPAVRGGVLFFGHELRYDEVVATRAAGETRDFLAAHLGR